MRNIRPRFVPVSLKRDYFSTLWAEWVCPICYYPAQRNRGPVRRSLDSVTGELEMGISTPRR